MRLPLSLLPLILVTQVIADVPPPRSAVFNNVDAPKAIALVKQDAAAGKTNPKHIPLTILDVRTPAEFASSRLQGAKNLDANSRSFKEELAKLDKSKPYLVHCGSGGRSSKARDLMKSLGFTHVTHLDGGIKAWKASGGPLVEGQPADPAPAPKAPKK